MIQDLLCFSKHVSYKMSHQVSPIVWRTGLGLFQSLFALCFTIEVKHGVSCKCKMIVVT